MSIFALSLADDGRILSATYEQYASADAVLVDALPTGETEREQDIHNWLYNNGEYVYDPLPVEEVSEVPTQIDRIEAQVTYTAMMTDTLLEV